MTLAPETLEALRSLVIGGASISKAARETGVCWTTACRYAERGFQPLPQRSAKADARSFRMAALYRAGHTLEQIGRQYGVTRERVRQIISKHHGMSADSGGARVAGIENKRKRAVERDARYLLKYGCTWAQYTDVRAIGQAMVKAGSKFGRTPLGAYCLQRRNARDRRIGWELSFWQWWSVWQASGHWEQRGRGQGYCMCRKGDTGPYALGNVFIASSRENSSDQSRKKSGLPIGVSRHRNRFHSHRCFEGSVRWLGSFATPEEAHAAYLAASVAA